MTNGHSRRGRARSRRGRRAVSEIIATLMILAMTVTLTAVFYGFVAGFTRGPGGPPLGSALAVTSGSPGSCGTKPAGCNYTFTVQEVGPGLTPSMLEFAVDSSSGTPMSYSYVALEGTSGCAVGVWTPSAGWTAPLPAGFSACTSGGPTTPITSGETFVLAAPQDLGPMGASFVIVGASTYTGAVSTPVS